MNEETVQCFIEEFIEECDEKNQVEDFRMFIEQLSESLEGTENEEFFMTLSEAVLELQKEYEYEKEM